jgi:hypothetical protein
MAFPFDVKEMWNKAFRQSSTNTKIAVQVENTNPINVNVLSDESVNWDEIQATYPSSVQEVYTYKLSSVNVQTVTVNYTNASKKTILSVLKVLL